jgi:hypothetical protein
VFMHMFIRVYLKFIKSINLCLLVCLMCSQCIFYEMRDGVEAVGVEMFTNFGQIQTVYPEI